MNDRQRAGAAIAALVVAMCAACPAGAQASKPTAHVPASHTTAKAAMPSSGASGSPVLASINGENITRAEVFDQLMADQMARLSATLPELADRTRPVAGSVGALVLMRMRANGNKPVTVSRADIMDWLFKDKSPVVTQAVAQAVETMIRQHAIAQAARKQNVAIVPGDIAARTADLANNARTQLRLANMSDAQVIHAVGVRPEYLREQIVTQLQAEAMLKKDLEKKFGHPVDKGDFVDVSHILVAAQTDPTNAQNTEKNFADALTKIKGYAEEIATGKRSFETIAAANSDDPGSKIKQGSLGVIMRGQTVPEFDKVAFSLEPGKVSEPVRTQFGWHLIRVNRLGKDTTGPERAQAMQAYMRGPTGVGKLVNDIMQTAKVVRNLPQPTAPMMPGQ